MAIFKDCSLRHTAAGDRSPKPATNPPVIAVLWGIFAAMAGLIVIGAVISND